MLKVVAIATKSPAPKAMVVHWDPPTVVRAPPAVSHMFPSAKEASVPNVQLTPSELVRAMVDAGAA